jgi:hypothetical protein
MHKENTALWKVKHLQTRLIGDHDWVPCHMMIGPNDIELYDDDYIDRPQGSIKSDESILLLEHTRNEDKPNGNLVANGDHRLPNFHDPQHNPTRTQKADISMADADTPPNEVPTVQSSSGNGEPIIHQAPRHDTKGHVGDGLTAKEINTQLQTNGRVRGDESIRDGTDALDAHIASGPTTNGLPVPGDSDTANTQVVSLSVGVARRTVNEISRPVSVLSDSIDDLPIHPMFIAPSSARPDRDLGIPESEAEDMRRLLQLYVQKQEEVCRGTKRLYEGLLKADRMRKTVFSWSKYEAHVGPNRDMSDGEDWYDKEEWGLEEDLKKGQDEEEDDIPPPPKKTRARR